MVKWLLLAACACTSKLQGTQYVHQITNSGDSITYTNYDIKAIVGTNRIDTYDVNYTDATGDWEISGPASGFGDAPLFVQFGDAYLCTAERTIDLSFYELGRANAQYPSTTTNVTVNLTGLDAWSTKFDLEFFALDSATGIYSPQVGATNPPAGGATQTNFTFDWNTTGSAMPQGDLMFVTELENRTAGALEYQTVGRVAQVPSASVSNGGSSTITGSMSAVTGSTSYAVDIDNDSFQQYVDDMPKGGVPTGVYLYVDAKPGGLTIPFTGNVGLPDVLVVHTTQNVQGTAMLGNPFPSGWTPFAFAFGGYAFTYTAPGASSGATLHAYMEVDRDMNDTSTWQPEISPVRHVKINGLDAFETQMRVGQRPLLTWDAPRVGSPTAGYQVTVDQVTAMNGQTVINPVAFLYTKSPSVRVPPGVMVPGSAYVFRIRAEHNDRDIETSTYQTSLPYADSTQLTAMMLP